MIDRRLKLVVHLTSIHILVHQPANAGRVEKQLLAVCGVAHRLAVLAVDLAAQRGVLSVHAVDVCLSLDVHRHGRACISAALTLLAGISGARRGSGLFDRTCGARQAGPHARAPLCTDKVPARRLLGDDVSWMHRGCGR